MNKIHGLQRTQDLSELSEIISTARKLGLSADFRYLGATKGNWWFAKSCNPGDILRVRKPKSMINRNRRTK